MTLDFCQKKQYIPWMEFNGKLDCEIKLHNIVVYIDCIDHLQELNYIVCLFSSSVLFKFQLLNNPIHYRMVTIDLLSLER